MALGLKMTVCGQNIDQFLPTRDIFNRSSGQSSIVWEFVNTGAIVLILGNTSQRWVVCVVPELILTRSSFPSRSPLSSKNNKLTSCQKNNSKKNQAPGQKTRRYKRDIDQIHEDLDDGGVSKMHDELLKKDLEDLPGTLALCLEGKTHFCFKVIDPLLFLSLLVYSFRNGGTRMFILFPLLRHPRRPHNSSNR